MATTINKIVAGASKFNFKQLVDTLCAMNYYGGGFERRMSKREAGLIVGISPSSPAKRVKEIHKRLMLINHPDRGGSPLISSKINEAKDILLSKNKH